MVDYIQYQFDASKFRLFLNKYVYTDENLCNLLANTLMYGLDKKYQSMIGSITINNDTPQKNIVIDFQKSKSVKLKKLYYDEDVLKLFYQFLMSEEVEDCIKNNLKNVYEADIVFRFYINLRCSDNYELVSILINKLIMANIIYIQL